MSTIVIGTPAPSTGAGGSFDPSQSVNFTGTLQKGGFDVVTIDGTGKIASSLLPQVAITDSFPVASQAEMLALTAQQGDVAIRSDLNKTFILSTSPASTLANWLELKTPTDLVSSVDGQTGPVSLGTTYAAIAGPFKATRTGATASAGLAGGTLAGAPTTGTWAAGELVPSQDGRMYLNTSGGTPGTWATFGPVSSATPQPIASTADPGSATSLASSTHAHAQQSAVRPTGITGTTNGTRYVGAVTAIPPLAGTYTQGDIAADNTHGVLGLATSSSVWSVLTGNRPPSLKTATYTALYGDCVMADTTSAGFTVTLPTDTVEGGDVTVKKIDVSANNLTVAAAGAGTIDGASTSVWNSQWMSKTFRRSGINWMVI